MSIILFDLDGVLVNNLAISDYVVDKSVRYLQKHATVPVRYRTYKHMKKLNKLAYTSLGHTSFIVDDTRNGVWEYNDYVFDQDTLDFVRNSVNDTDRRRIRDIANALVHRDMQVGLCTNTPIEYCNAVFDGLCYDMDKLFNVCFTSDMGYLKPTENFYENVEYELGNNYKNIYFLDDNARNTTAVQQRERWFPQHVPTRTALFDALGRIH